MPNYDLSLDKATAIYEEAADRAEADIIKQGLPLPIRPLNRHGEFADMPRLPYDLSECRPAERTRLMGQLTEWYGYALSQLKIAENRRNVAAKNKDLAWARVRKDKEGTISDKDDATRIDSRFVHVDALFEYREGMVRLLAAIVRQLERDIETVSRTYATTENRSAVEGRNAGLARRVGATMAEGRRSALDVFKKGRR